MRASRWPVMVVLPAIMLASCVTPSPHPSSEVWTPAPTRAQIEQAMVEGLARSQDYTTHRLPALHEQVVSTIAHLDAPQRTAAERHQDEVNLREYDYLANQISVNTGVQLNAIQAAAEPWLAQCSAPALKDALGCRSFVHTYQAWDAAQQAMWSQLTGPVLRWRDAINAAVNRHPNDPAVPVDYLRGEPRCMVHDLRTPPDFTAI